VSAPDALAHPNGLARVRVVLVRPEHAGNVGAVARAMKNMGLSELVLVAPAAEDAGAARAFAHGAEDVLDSARTAATLRDALADCRWVAGVTRRTGRRRATAQTPREFAAAVCRDPERRPLALLFGPERDGLGAADLALCHDLVTIPSLPPQPSLNLAQAVLVVAYELLLAHTGADPGAGGGAGGAIPEPAATAAELEGMYGHLEETLRAIGFVQPHTAADRMGDLRRLLARAGPGSQEVQLLRGICRQVLWALRRPGRV
jgi:tRNA (cytidine32/uridine32-2'-O)-methyltransferase